MRRLQSFLEEARQEFKRINWPGTSETIRMTAVVVTMSVIVAAFLGGVDYVLLYILNNYIF